ncbi:MAG: DUF1800 family protein [Burkholderiales bacterium]
MSRRSHLGRLAGLLLYLCGAGIACADLGTAIEFYNPGIDHYFITAYPEEAAALDAGTNVKGWKRTGGQFSVYVDPGPGRAAVCRFFGTPGKGPNSHFYTADPAECAKVKTLPAWTYEGIAFHIPLPAGGNCASGYPVYRSYYSDQVSDFNHRFTVDLTAHVRMAQRRHDDLEGVVMCAPVWDAELEADVVRLLEQATLGPTEALVAEVRSKGVPQWLDEQLAQNVTRYTQLPYTERVNDPLVCKDDDTPPRTPEKYCVTNTQSPGPVGWEFFRQASTAPDQLRLRMAHNWHEIFVAQGAPTYGIAAFQQRIRDGVFDTFEGFLTSYSISPLLGFFQSWVYNRPEHNGIKPNENYARELMQLMTIGVSELNEDGTLLLDAAGQPIPTYGQADIEVLARVLTGYDAPPLPPGVGPVWNPANKEYYLGDMVTSEQPGSHDQGAKTALAGRLQFAAGGSASADVHALFHVLVNHPNTPPFIVRQMIQKTVTSSPTPGYVSRIVAVFKDNGKGVRGDLAAVTRAILLDPEARGARKIDPQYGRLREPVLFLAGIVRALDIVTDGNALYGLAFNSGQPLFNPATVFGYYPSDYTLAGGAIPAPEFGIYGSAEFITRTNHVTALLYHDTNQGFTPYYGPQGYVPNATGTSVPSLSAFMADAADADKLVSHLDRLLLHSTMTADARRTIISAVNKIPASDARGRARLAVSLVLVSIDYQIQK